MQRDPVLFQVVFTLRPPSGLTGLLNRGQQQGNQDRDNGNHNQQLNERKAPAQHVLSCHDSGSQKIVTETHKMGEDNCPSLDKIVGSDKSKLHEIFIIWKIS
jgi:hypothetical protein